MHKWFVINDIVLLNDYIIIHTLRSKYSWVFVCSGSSTLFSTPYNAWSFFKIWCSIVWLSILGFFPLSMVLQILLYLLVQQSKEPSCAMCSSGFLSIGFLSRSCPWTDVILHNWTLFPCEVIPYTQCIKTWGPAEFDSYNWMIEINLRNETKEMRLDIQ